MNCKMWTWCKHNTKWASVFTMQIYRWGKFPGDWMHKTWIAILSKINRNMFSITQNKSLVEIVLSLDKISSTCRLNNFHTLLPWTTYNFNKFHTRISNLKFLCLHNAHILLVYLKRFLSISWIWYTCNDKGIAHRYTQL